MQLQEDVWAARKQRLDNWVSAYLGEQVIGAAASSDASFRRYFRYAAAGTSLIAMDAPPPQEDCRPFVDIAQRLLSAGLHVPHILAADIDAGFLLLSDLGYATWLDILDNANADAHFEAALDLLIELQQVSYEGLPAYDEALIARELALFPDWYLAHERCCELNAAQQADWQQLCALLTTTMLEQPQVFVHRDFMPRNLMQSTPNPGVLDFQDAVAGPIAYDAVCLFRDAFLSWPEARVDDWLERYYHKGRLAGLPLPDKLDTFQRWADFTGVQRHLKVIGIFARICHRDGKPRYLADVPRFFRYLEQQVARYDELAPLGRLLQQLAPASV